MPEPDPLQAILDLRIGDAYPRDYPGADVIAQAVARRLVALEARVLELEIGYTRHLDKCHTFPPKT